MRQVLDLIARHKRGESVGLTSVCSAHPLVIEAACVHALRNDVPLVLIEATSNQVNQHGGYTGMVPATFRDFVYGIAGRAGLPRARILLGGDHLGPNVWTAFAAEAAMANAEVMIEQYVRAGFRKIHLDCSMSCQDDPAPLPETIVAGRAARLCAVAERAHAAVGGEPPVYVIGTEVPVPGGAADDLDVLAVTTPKAAQVTIDLHRNLFETAGLADAWRRVVALVVQPGVEFDHHRVVDYDRSAALSLSASIASHPAIVFEAHSTDYQTPKALAELVEDHFAILKVGPGVTFALREALWGLEAIERELITAEQRSNLRSIVIDQMKAEPKYWQKYYHSTGAGLDLDLEFSLSDRIRYYWPEAMIQKAQSQLFDNLAQNPIPLALISQYLPRAYTMIRDGSANASPAGLVRAQIESALDAYCMACMPSA